MMEVNEVTRLRERVEELEELLGLNEKIPRSVFEGPNRVRIEVVAKLLLARELVSKTAIVLAIGGADLLETTAGVYIHHLRKQLAPHKIEVLTEWGHGWRLDAANKAKLRALFASGGRTDAQRSEAS